MKPSRYNFIFPYQFNKDYSAVYNSLMDTVGIVTIREAEFIRSCDISLGIHYTKIEDFKKKGFIIDENTSELSKIKVEYLKRKFDTKLLSVVIVPTYQCNLNCEYCYEKLSYSVVDNTIMSEQIQDNICNWIKNNLDGVEKLEIFWHGGEPLVALDVVKRLGGMLKSLAEERQVKFVSEMSTNGYLFTESVAKDLKELGITRYKMSMDGCRERHDARKRHKEGGATYDIILDNLKKGIDYVDEIDLRINIDKEDLKDAYDIMKILEEKGLSEKVIPRLGKPAEFADQINDVNFTKEEFGCEAIHYSLLQGIGPKEFSRKDCFCVVDQLNGFIVDGHGMLFKCVSDTGDGQSCGKLKEDGTLELNKNYYAYGAYHPIEEESCEQCPYLPICYGECIFDRREGNPCTYGSLLEKCWAQFINAYVVKRLLNRLKTKGFSLSGGKGINIDQLIMGKYDKKINKFINNAASTYLLGDLAALAEKNDIHMSSEDMNLLLQLIQPTELAL
ncbi:MAG: radical SAM protein [Bacillota bacterium]